MTWEVRQGDVLDRLREMADGSVHCAVTSPPYWGLRDYGVDGQIGLESTPEEYVALSLKRIGLAENPLTWRDTNHVADAPLFAAEAEAAP